MQKSKSEDTAKRTKLKSNDCCVERTECAGGIKSAGSMPWDKRLSTDPQDEKERI
jgi:hypothetical protein